ncbi:MAG: Ig-like domain-containing protein [Anaerolineae bacterium]|jgi:hypothetical protein
MRRKRRRLVAVLGLLGVAILAFLAVILWSGEDWLSQLLQGAGVAMEGQPSVFPAANLVSDPSIPGGEGLGGGLSDTPIVLNGILESSCEVWGTDPRHPDGIHYAAGTLDLSIDDASAEGYSLDLEHVMRSGDAYQANLYASSEPELCPALWIVSTFHRDAPGDGLSSAEEGAAIQAAIWYYVADFEPAWEPESWCGKQAVYARAQEIMDAAEGQCLPLPASLDLTVASSQLEPGQTAHLTASIRDQIDAPLTGQEMAFATTLGSVDPAGAATNAQGQASTAVTVKVRGSARVTAAVSGSTAVAAVDPIGQPFQRLLALTSIPYSLEASVDVLWEGSTAVSLVTFQANWLPADDPQGPGVALRWQTAAETGSVGFNLYRGTSAQGPWTPLNQSLIPSQAVSGSSSGATYEWIDGQAQPGLAYFYLLEDVDAAGIATQHGPTQP